MFRKAIPGAALLAIPTLAMAAPPSPESLALAQKFGALESVQQISLSPDGRKAAYFASGPAAQVIYIVDLVAGGQPTPVGKVNSAEGAIRWCNWSSSQRMVCQIAFTVDDAGQLIGFSRLISLNSDGTNTMQLTPSTNSRSLGFSQYGGGVIDWDVPGKPGTVLMARVHVPERSMGTIIKKEEEGLGVDEVDTLSLRRRSVEAPRRDAVEYISDGHGTVRVMGTQRSMGSGYARDNITYFYRMPDSREWKPLSTVNASQSYSEGFEPYAVDRTRNVVYGFDQHGGTRALVSIALDGSNRREIVLSRPDVDIDGLMRIGRDDRVVGASYSTERRVAEFFDPELKKLSASLSKALPGQPDVIILDASEGESKLLLMATSDINPGMLYLFDKASRRLEELLPVRAELQGATLAKMQPVTYPAADGTQIPGYLTLPPGSSGKNLPAIVMPHGGPGSRDEWGFDWLVQYFAARGFAVLQPNFRGSAGYGQA